MKIASGFLGMMAALQATGCAHEVQVANHDSKALVAAIRAANAAPGRERIVLAHRGLYVLDAGADPGLLLPATRGNLVIDGDGAEIRSYAPGPVALLEVGKGSDVVLKNLSLAEGSNGAVRNFGKLNVESSRVTDSTGTDLSAIVLNYGELVARNSEIAYNALDESRREAATLLNYGELQLDNTHIHDNGAQSAIVNLGRGHAN